LRKAVELHGLDSFVFEELEQLEEETLRYIVNKRLLDRAAHWRAKLGAQAI
jgi:hypothetical protein